MNKLIYNLKNRRYSLKQKILVPIILVNILVCMSMGMWLNAKMGENMQEMATQQALTVATFVADSIDGDALEQIQVGDENTPEYLEIAENLKHAKSGSSIAYLYTLYTDKDKVFFGVDADQDKQIGDAYAVPYSSMVAAFNGESTVDDQIYHTVDGQLIGATIPIYNSKNQVVSVLGCDYDASSIVSKIDRNTAIVTIITVLAVLLQVLVCTGIITKAIKPLKAATEIAEKIHKCDLSENASIVLPNDEIGELTGRFIDISDSLRQIIFDIRYQLDQIRKGNFCVESNCPDEYTGEYVNILNAINDIRKGLSVTLTEIASASTQVNDSASQVSDGAQALSQRTTEQAATIEELSASIEEIAKQVTDNAGNAKDATAISKESGTYVNDSNQSMQAFIDAMRDIESKSQEISNIIKVIDNIAFQTNLLALNAAVEAARAGSAGKGFAVVADEVRNLAQKSADAAKDTSALIESTVLAVNHGTDLAERTAESLKAVVEKTHLVETKILEISDACSQQASGVDQINVGISQISAVVQSNSATAEESAATSEELSAQSNLMKALVEKFQLLQQ